MKPRILLVVLLLSGPAISSHAGDNPRSVTAIRVSTPPRIDGIVSDSVWSRAQPATDFVQRDPVEGSPASERTEIRVLYDDDALYFGCMFFDSQPDRIVARLTRRDNEIETDNGSIRIDPFHDNRTAYEFTFSAAGVKVDILQFDDAEREDESWDVVWDLETQMLSNGWSAELRIPLSVLRYEASPGDSAEQVWGVNFLRFITRENEQDRWAFTPKSMSGFVSRFGHLRGLRSLPAPRTVEALPFVVGSYRRQPPDERLEPDNGFDANAGVDMKFGMSSNLTLDLTVNPDFGQVEADPAVLNLSTFETFYPEKRPFFIEGSQIMKFSTFGGDDEDGGPGLFYSRRIGRAISSDEVELPEGGKITALPSSVGIAGAAKLTGRVNGGFSMGLLTALTEREFASVADPAGKVSNALIEPLGSYNVLRLRQDVLDGSTVGMLASAVAKEGRATAFSGGADWNIKLDDATYLLDGFVAVSSTATGFESRHEGSAGKAEFSRISAIHWLWSLSADYTTRFYNINDVGYFRRPNDYGGFATLKYKEDVPGELARSYAVSLNLHERWNFDRANISRSGALTGSMTFYNYMGASASGGMDAGKYDDRETRGNGLYGKPLAYSASAHLFTDDRHAVSGSIGEHVGWDDKAKRLSATDVGVEIRPNDWIECQVEATYQRVRTQEAWVENVEEPAGTVSVFADRNTDEVDIGLHGILTFTRTLTLQVYGQVFMAKGTYANFRKLVGTSSFDAYAYAGSPDFNERSLILNVVLRWEYLPGSTMYVVWSQSRQGGSSDYYTSINQDVADTFATPPANVFLVKLNYWLSM